MEILGQLAAYILHLDRNLVDLTAATGGWIYVVLFLVVFCETGLVVTPFLPGDSLLFAVGSLAALGALDLAWMLGLLVAAAFLGDTVNYWAGHLAGPKVFRGEGSRFLNREHLERTHGFYERHGGKTIVIARFLPIIRTFAPFVAGIGRMRYTHFMAYNLGGGILWVLGFVLGGYYFGNLSVVRRHFSLVILALVLIPAIPAVVEVARHWAARRRSGSAGAA
jgi:membrane-associated protein